MGTKYVRKTVDEYVVQGNYGNGWDDLTVEESMKDAKARKKDYLENDTVPIRIIKHRIRKEA